MVVGTSNHPTPPISPLPKSFNVHKWNMNYTRSRCVNKKDNALFRPNNNLITAHRVVAEVPLPHSPNPVPPASPNTLTTNDNHHHHHYHTTMISWILRTNNQMEEWEGVGIIIIITIVTLWVTLAHVPFHNSTPPPPVVGTLHPSLPIRNVEVIYRLYGSIYNPPHTLFLFG